QSRVALSPVILRALDELPPLLGALIGTPGPVALLGPCVVVAAGEPLANIAERYLPRVGGAILITQFDAPAASLMFEARAHGAVAMLRAAAKPEAMPNHPIIFVVDAAELADQFAIARLE